MIPTSSPSSSSTLSPLAPPFTVDRPSTAHRLQPCCYPPPPPAAEFNGKESSPVKSVGESSSWMDPSLPYPHSPFRGGGAAESFVGYGDAYGAWHGKHVDSSARPHIGGADSSGWQGESLAVYEEKARDSCNNGLSYFQLPNPNLAMNECDTSNSNSSYSRYMSQLVSGSTDPIVYYPASTCSSSAEVFAPANETGSSMYFTPRNCYSTPHHGNLLYNVDDNYVDYMLGNKKETDISPYSDGKDGYVKGGAAEDKMKEINGAGNSSITRTWPSLGNTVTTRNSMDYSTEVKCGFRTKQLNFNESIASSSMPNSSLQTSSDILDQPHLVDSPCWRGASVSQQYLFGSAEMVGPPHNEVQESKAYDDQGQNYLPVSDQYLKISPCQEKDGSPVCNFMKGSSPFSGDFSPNISLYGTDKRFPDINAKGSESAEVGEDKSSLFSCVISVKRNEVKDSEKYSEQVKRNVKQSGEMSSAALPADIPSLVGEGANIKAGLTDATQDDSFDPNLYADNHVSNFSVVGVVTGQVAKPTDSTDPAGKCITVKETRLLVKALHSLSEVLLSSSYDGGVEWEECDNDLVQLVIDNLETFTCSKKEMKRSSHSPENERGQSQVSVPKSNDTVKKHSSTSTKDAEGKFCCAGSCMNSDKFDIRRSNGVTQVLVKDLENDVFAKKEDDPQAVLYKKLWMQAEAALCSMKYELQVARMKLEIENCECQMKEKEPIQVKKSPMLNFMPSFDAPVFATQESLCNHASCYAPAEEDACKSNKEKQKEQKTNKNDKLDSSVMDRLEVLKGRYARSNKISIEEQPKCSDTENTLKGLPAWLADLGFVESGIPQPFDEDGNRDSPSSTFERMPADIPHLAPTFNEQNNAFCVEISEHAVVHTSDVPPYQSFMPSMGNQINPMRFILG